MSAEDDIADVLTRHQIFVLRYAQGREREAEEFIVKLIRGAVDRLGTDVTDFQRNRLERQIADLYEYLLAGHRNMRTSCVMRWSSFYSMKQISLCEP